MYQSERVRSAVRADRPHSGPFRTTQQQTTKTAISSQKLHVSNLVPNVMGFGPRFRTP